MRLTRFLRNDSVTPEEMLAEAAAGTAQRCVGRHVLALQDTTVLRSAGGGGEYLHAVLAVDAEEGAILGLIDGQFLERSSGRRGQRRQAGIEEKESFGWLEGAEQAASVCAGAACVTVIADRESDIFEAFALRPPEAGLVVRAAHDRSLADGGVLFGTTLRRWPGGASWSCRPSPGASGAWPAWKRVSCRLAWPGRRTVSAAACRPALRFISSISARAIRRPARRGCTGGC
jgi:hypothetical protein